MSFKDVTKRVEELTKSANELSDGEITYDEYDKRVNKFKPIIPYQTVPAPATTKEMVSALSEGKKAKVGKASEIQDNTPPRS